MHFIKKYEPAAFMSFISNKTGKSIRRVYLGSYFCSQYFLNVGNFDSILSLCKSMNIPVTLTVPVFSQKDLQAAKKKITVLCGGAYGDTIDQITVNDIGMLIYVQENTDKKINLGRLFFKDPRDCRVPNYGKTHHSPALISQLKDAPWSSFRISNIEIDQTNEVIDLSGMNETGIGVLVHRPYCFMTTGNICKFASIDKTAEEKFRPNAACALQCAHIKDYYTGHVMQTDCDPKIVRLGRTLYFLTAESTMKGYPLSGEIYFPINELEDFANEHISAAV